MNNVTMETEKPFYQYCYEAMKVGQYIYLRLEVLDREKNFALMRSGIRKDAIYLQKMEWPYQLDKSDGRYEGWFRIGSIVPNKKGKLAVYPEYDVYPNADTKMLMPQTVCLGRIKEIDSKYIHVEYAPGLTAVMLRSKYVQKEFPNTGDLCVFKITYNENGVVGGYIIGTNPVPNPVPNQVEVIDHTAPEKFDGCITCSDALIERSKKYLGIDMSNEDIRQQIAEDYDREKKRDKIIYSEDGRTFSYETSLYKVGAIGKAPVIVSIIRTLDKHNKAQYSAIKMKLMAAEMHTLLERDIYAEDWDEEIAKLAEMCLHENWNDNTASETLHNPILHSYIDYTYYVAYVQKKIADGQGDGSCYRIFNTGLVNNMYDPIYAVLERTTPEEKRKGIKQEHVLRTFTVAGSGSYGKKIASYFSQLPDAVQYIGENNHIFLDGHKEILIDKRHILIDNIDRLPDEFIARYAYNDMKIKELMNDVSSARSRLLAEYIESERPDIINMLANELSMAVDVARKRAIWNYKTAVPILAASSNRIELILPLCLSPYGRLGAQKADVALVLSRQPSGNYQGETIITLDMAYKQSRLITRPDGDWLKTC